MSLYTEDNVEVPQVRLSLDMVLNRSIVLYGASKSGKTVFIKHILDMLRGHVQQGIVVAPTEPVNQSYVDYFPPALIHYDMRAKDPKNPTKVLDGEKGAVQFITNICDRQMMLKQTCVQANRVEVLRGLVARLPSAVRKQIDQKLAPIRVTYAKTQASLKKKYRHNPGDLKDKLRDTDELLVKIERGLCKHYITENYERLWNARDLSEEEVISLTYIDLNPHSVLIFDDCGADLVPIMLKPIFKNLFYRNRHLALTVIFVFQADTDLKPALRDNAFISIFCDSKSANKRFERDKSNKKQLCNIAASVFQAKYRKLLYIRDDPNQVYYYHSTAPPAEGKMFPSSAILDLCRAIERKAGMTDTSNPFYKKFHSDK